MRQVTAILGLGLLVVLAVGCNSTRWNFLKPQENNLPGGPVDGKVPTVRAIVEYMNINASRVETLEARTLDVTVRQPGMPTVTLHGKMVAKRPKGFRMSLDGPLGFTQVADLGSNNEEFWFWLSKAPKPYQYYCSYEDLKKGVQFLPIPFQPEWIMETLGLGPYGPPERYQVESDEKTQTLRLSEVTRSPQGTPVRKVIVMKSRETKAPDPQVTHYLLIDETTRKEICSAHILQTMVDPGTGAILPRRVDLHWALEDATLSMSIEKAAVNVQLPPTAFARPTLTGVQAYNLARGQVDPPGLKQVQGMQPK
jgi:hypothetical protein